MKKKLFFLFALTMLVMNVARAQEIKEDLIYAVVEGSTATYYYDNKYEERENVSMPYWDMEDEAAERLAFADNITKIVFDPSMDKASLTSTVEWFSGLALLEEIDGLQYLHTEEVTNMAMMFSGCKSLISLDLSTFNTEKVTKMGGMFSECQSLTSLDLSTFNTEKVTNMGTMFGRCQSLTSLDLSTFNTANVTDMSAMFSGCQSLTSLDLSTFNSANVTNMAGMFMQCTALKNIDLTGFNTENVTDMDQMFALCEALTTLDLRSFNIDKVEEMSYMFYECKELTTIYCNDNWGAYGILGDDGMFAGCKKLVGGHGTTFNYTTGIDYAHPDGGKDAPGYFTATPQVYTALEKDGFLYYYFDDQRAFKEGLTAVYDADDSNWLNMYSSKKVHYAVIDESMKNTEMTSMNYLFAGLDNLYEIYDLQNLNTAGVTSMHGLFADCQYLDNLDLTTFNTDNVTDMASMFSGCSFLAYLDISSFNTELVTDMSNMFTGTQLTALDLSLFNTANVTDMSTMFYQCSELKEIELGSFNTANVTNMYGMFAECAALKELDLGSFNTEKVTNMSGMFIQCAALENINLSSFNTDNVTDMAGMFAECTALKALDLTHFNTANVKVMNMMFAGCEKLTTIYAKGYWDKNEVVEDSEDMFYGCKKLVGENGTAYDESKTDITYARPDGGTDAPGYFTTPTYTVTFLDWDATPLFKETVKDGQDAKGPEKDPTREGYIFTGWSKPVTNITSDLTVIAQYKDKNATALYETGIQTTDDCRKFIEKGILYIERNVFHDTTHGEIYTIQDSNYTIQGQHLN